VAELATQARILDREQAAVYLSSSVDTIDRANLSTSGLAGSRPESLRLDRSSVLTRHVRTSRIGTKHTHPDSGVRAEAECPYNTVDREGSAQTDSQQSASSSVRRFVHDGGATGRDALRLGDTHPVNRQIAASGHRFSAPTLQLSTNLSKAAV
jgi:hypothetical protein